MEQKMNTLKLKGLDDYPQKRLNDYWHRFNSEESFADILGLSISTTNKCNLRCIYCYAGEERTSNKNDLSLDEQKNIISQACELGAKTLIICGDGEPTIDKNLIGIVEHANKKKMISVIVNNAVIFGDDNQSKKIHGIEGVEFLEKLYNANASLIIKMESAEKENYESIVGVKGTFEKFTKAINRIMECGFGGDGKSKITRLAFSSVVMKNNFNEINRLKQFADDRNAQYICKLPSLVGTSLKNLENMFGVDEYEKMRQYLSKYTAKRETLLVDAPRCMAWHYGPCIDVEGEARECYTSPCSPENRIGNIREKSLKELVVSKKSRCDLNCSDACPIKTRINNTLTE